MMALNKYNRKLKIWSVKMPNAPYSRRYVVLSRADFQSIWNLLKLNSDTDYKFMVGGYKSNRFLTTFEMTAPTSDK